MKSVSGQAVRGVMKTMNVKVPSELMRAADLEENSPSSREVARLLALELYREDKVLLGRAASCVRHRWRLS